MTETQRKALALVNEARDVNGLTPWLELAPYHCVPARALFAAIEQHEAFRQEVSDSLEHYLDQWRHSTPSREVFACQFGSFIIPKSDPLVEALNEAWDEVGRPAQANRLRAAMKARGYEWTEIVEDK